MRGMGVAGRELYQGTGLQLVDGKGRVAIPAALRTSILLNSPAVDAADSPKVSISAHPTQKCLIGCDKGWTLLQSARSTRQEEAFPLPDGEIDYNIKRKASGAGEDVGFDASGRFIMPAFPRFYAGIGEYAFFYGVYDYFEIWDPRTLVATDGPPEVMKAAARFFAAEKGITL